MTAEKGLPGTESLAELTFAVESCIMANRGSVFAGMRRLGYILYQPYKWLVFMPVLLLSTAFLGVLAVVLAVTLGPRIGSRVCGVTWARLNALLTPMPVRVFGRQHVDPRQSYVVVSNHKSHYDVFVLYGWLGIDFRWVMKQELRKVPFLGVGCEKIGHIFIDRSNHQAAVAAIEEAKERIVDGTSVLFFPEGTRSRSGELGRFKKGAFRMALDLGLPLLPVTVLGTDKVLPAESRRLRPGRATLVIHEPIPIDGLEESDIPQLIDRVREIMLRALGETEAASTATVV
jgi:1-acyl-sn-glycerol-3-phosphate acyltransferase